MISGGMPRRNAAPRASGATSKLFPPAPSATPATSSSHRRSWEEHSKREARTCCSSQQRSARGGCSGGAHTSSPPYGTRAHTYCSMSRNAARRSAGLPPPLPDLQDHPLRLLLRSSPCMCGEATKEEEDGPGGWSWTCLPISPLSTRCGCWRGRDTCTSRATMPRLLPRLLRPRAREGWWRWWTRRSRAPRPTTLPSCSSPTR
mmetsp:Transcript_62830/g.149687  ORF Transcript_62830/g.149687 Transcript_62830/m.149687 type:complete len:203 (+) Transcript_62830:231-839(+)